MGAPEGAVVVCAKGKDPWVELDVRDMVLTGGDCEAIEVTVVAHSVSSMLLEAYERLVGIHESDEAVRREVAEATSSIQANLRSRFDQADVRAATVAERIDGLNGAVQAGMTAAAEAIARAAAKEAEQAALNSAALERAEARSAELFARLEVLAEGIRQWTGDAVRLAAQSATESAAESAAQAQSRALEVRSELLAAMKHAQGQALMVLEKTEQLESSLQSLQQTQDVLLRFAERRSFRYWMRRLFGRRK
jgi:hypothetical protein